MFVLASDVTIGGFRFSGVHEVRVKRSLHGIADSAVIKIPSISCIVTNGKAAPGSFTTGKLFNDGDPVTIQLGYNGDLREEFRGFVKRRDLNMPFEVTCEGYSWLLRRNTLKAFYASITVKDLLALAVSGIDPKYSIKVRCTVDFSINNLVIDDLTGFDIISNLSKYTDGCVSCFFIQPDTLWCGMLYTPYAAGNDVLNAGSVSYRLGYNVVKDNSLEERTSENDPVQVKYHKKQPDGGKLSGASDAYKNFVRTHSKILNHIRDASFLKQLANEKAYQLNYSGYEGSISAFLQPYALPGWKAYIADDRYPERNGNYVIESTEVVFGIKGARRIVEIGPKVGFANDKDDE